ncbi:hypothetical protein GOODEAATRI_020032 [Goodea atripinnis]|uniref:LAMB1/2/3/4 helical domain-containing protein n=1 Tax=Goodea atripinnis TaxID=208336 RepID=A0ABV0NXV6_9TELE
MAKPYRSQHCPANSQLGEQEMSSWWDAGEESGLGTRLKLPAVLVLLTCSETEQIMETSLFLSFLADEMVHPDEIEKMSNAVLSIQLPRSPAEIRSMIKDINNLLNGATRFQDDVKELQDEAKTAQELLQKATEIRFSV